MREAFARPTNLTDDQLPVFHVSDRVNLIAPNIRAASIRNIVNVTTIRKRQGLTFCLETGDYLLGVHAHLDDLQRPLVLDGYTVFRQLDGTQAALGDELENMVGANPFNNHRIQDSSN